jgi:hypothetical protein
MFQEVGPVVSNCLSHRNCRRKRRHGEGGKAHKKCVWGRGGGFKTGARLRDAANGRKQKFLSLERELRSIRYPVTSSLYHLFFASGGRESSNIMHNISVLPFCLQSLLNMQQFLSCVPGIVPGILEVQRSNFNANIASFSCLLEKNCWLIP